jgi:hypothetical protein
MASDTPKLADRWAYQVMELGKVSVGQYSGKASSPCSSNSLFPAVWQYTLDPSLDDSLQLCL